MTPNVQDLLDELADLARETIEAAADKRVTLDEVVDIGEDLGDVFQAIAALLPHDEAKKAARKARRAARKAARKARREAKKAQA